MNGLLALRQHQLNNVTIVLLNNNSGSIFRRLPVAKFEPPFTALFLTPHGLDFSHVAQLYGVTYLLANDYATFTRFFANAVTGGQPTIIEVQTDGAVDQQHQQTFSKRILERINHA